MPVQGINLKHLYHRSSVRTEMLALQAEVYKLFCSLTFCTSAVLNIPKTPQQHSDGGKSRALWMLQREERARQHDQHQSQSSRSRSWGPNRSHPRWDGCLNIKSLNCAEVFAGLWRFRVYKLRMFPPCGNSGVKQSSLVITPVLFEV